MEYNEFLELAKDYIQECIHVGDGSFETYRCDVEGFQKEHADIIEQYGLTEPELFVMFMMLKKNFSDIQEQFFIPSKSNKFTKECASCFDSLLQKLPHSEAPMFYRGDEYQCIDNFKGRATYTFRNFLTVSTHRSIFNNYVHGIKFIIRRRLIGKSKAHEVFKIYNLNDEYQVNFERGTRFQIDSINQQEKIIELTEL